MCVAVSLLPATLALVLAYVVFFLAKRSEGIARALGRALGLWLVGIALCVVVFGACVQVLGRCRLDRAVVRVLTPRPKVQQVGAGKPGPGRSF